MKNLRSLLSLAILSLLFTSCCSMFGGFRLFSGKTTKTYTCTCGYDIVQEEVYTPGSSKSGKDGMTQVVEKRVPRTKTVTKTEWIRCPKCTRYFCPKKDCCGTTSEATMRLATSQGGVGSPHIGLIPTMKKLPLETKKN